MWEKTIFDESSFRVLAVAIALFSASCATQEPPADFGQRGARAGSPETKAEIMAMGNEITQERLASYERFECRQIESEFAHTAGRYEYQAKPRTFERAGTVEIFFGGDVRYILAIRKLMDVANERNCEVRSIDCSKYPKTCQAL